MACQDTEVRQVRTYECTGDFEVRPEPDRTITLRDTVYHFWSIRERGTGEIKCFVAVKKNKKLYNK